MNATLAELGWLLAPATALLLGCLALVPLGCQVLARGVVFIDLAVAQVAACGALAGPLLHFSDPAPHAGSPALASHAGHDHGHDAGNGGHHHDQPASAGQVHAHDDLAVLPDWQDTHGSALTPASWSLPDGNALLWTMSFAAAAALLVWWLARRSPQRREALIGLVYVAAASTALLLVTADPHGRERLDQLLAADVLWAAWPPILLLGVASACCTLAWSLVRFRLRTGPRDGRWPELLFYPLFALTLSVAVPVLGLYLVFALLIGPALWQRPGRGPGTCLGIALLACAGGLLLSWHHDWPSGACIAICLSVSGLAAVLRPRPAN